MDEAHLIGYIIIGVGSIATVLITVLSPLFKMNSNITSIKNSIDHMLENDKRRDERINNHGREIDAVVRQVDKHEVRISALEDKMKD